VNPVPTQIPTPSSGTRSPIAENQRGSAPVVVPDAVAYAIVMDAITHPGPADLGRINPSVCDQDLMPGADRRDADADRVGFSQNAPVLLGEHHTPDEPPPASYVGQLG
jgi:hypothetical protein